MKTALIASAIGLLFAGASIAPAWQPQTSPSPGSIRFIQSQRILAESIDAKAEIARVQAAQQEKTADLQTRQRALEQLRQQVAQATNAATRASLQQQEAQQKSEIDRLTAQYQSEIQTLQRQMQVGLQARVKAVVDQLAKEQSFQLVLNSETAVVWAIPALDLTPVIIERLNAGRTLSER